ncbi:MAG: histidine kinase [Firmicutes bacterium]|nr:histidine kinase [Bacillota bacterium]
MNSKKLSIWHYIRNYKLNSIFIQNMFIILILVVISLIAINITTYNYYNKVMKEEISEANMSKLEKVRDMIDMLVLEADKLSTRLVFDSDVNALMSGLKHNRNDYDTIKQVNKINHAMTVSMITSDYINSMYIYFEKSDYIITSLGEVGEISKSSDQDWLDLFQNSKNNYDSWFEPRLMQRKMSDDDAQYIISKFVSIPSRNKDETGVVVINIDGDKIANVINDIGSQKAEAFYLVDQYQRILYNKNTDLLGKNINECDSFDSIDIGPEDKNIVTQFEGRKQVVSIIKSQYCKWQFISVVPIEKFEEKVAVLKEFIFFLLLLSVFIAFVLSVIISVRVFKPIKNLTDIINHPQNWEDNYKIHEAVNGNEFRYIASNIIENFNLNASMTEELARYMALLNKAQSIALQAQINPHFIHNTLENINWIIIRIVGGKNKASSTIAALSKLLRNSLDTEEQTIAVEKELENAQLYIEILKARYEDRFDITWHIDQKILQYNTIKIMLQPILENAVYHGIRPLKRKGIIAVKGYEEEEKIVFEIQDNGVGIDEKALTKMVSELEKDYIREKDHIGVKNVNQRIKLTFGHEYGIMLESKLGEGTLVKITIPKVQPDIA